MGSVVRLQRWSFRASSLPASMMWPGGCAPTGSSWILQRPRFSGLHPVDASVCYPCHPSVAPNFGVYTTLMCQWGRMSQRLSLRFCDSASTAEYSSAIVAQFRAPFFSHWFRLSFCSGWTMVTQYWLTFHPIPPSAASGCSRCWSLLLGLCFLHRGTTACRITSLPTELHSALASLSWLFWYTDAYTRQHRRTLLRNSISHLLTRLVSVSALHRHHRLLSHARTCLSTIGDRAFPVAAARLWNTAAEQWTSRRRRQCLIFRKHLKTHILSHYFLQLSCSAVILDTIIDLFYLLTYICYPYRLTSSCTSWNLEDAWRGYCDNGK